VIESITRPGSRPVFSGDGGHFYAGGGFKVVIGR
jgi:hypothetical protein